VEKARGALVKYGSAAGKIRALVSLVPLSMSLTLCQHDLSFGECDHSELRHRDENIGAKGRIDRQARTEACRHPNYRLLMEGMLRRFGRDGYISDMDVGGGMTR